MEQMIMDMMHMTPGPYSGPMDYYFMPRFGFGVMIFAGFAILVGVGGLIVWLGWGENTRRKRRT